MEGRKIIRKYLTMEERTLYVYNTAWMTLEVFKNTMDRDWDTPEEIICHSFDWENTPEGSAFWADIVTRIVEGIVINPEMDIIKDVKPFRFV